MRLPGMKLNKRNSSEEQRKWERIFRRFRSSNNYQAALDEKERFEKPRPFRKLLKIVARCKYTDGKKHPHAKKICKVALKAGRKALLQNCARIERGFESFHDFHQFLASLAEPIHGLGPLTVYDWACRIGFRLKLYPDYVYLHSGTNKGARAIRPKLKARIDDETRYLRICDLPRPLRKAMDALTPAMQPWELEDIFCIRKRTIRRMYAAHRIWRQ
jgi:hypothetical protein